MNYIVAFKHLKGNCVQERFGLAKEKSGYRIRLILVLYVYILIASRAVKEKKKKISSLCRWQSHGPSWLS